MKASLQFMKIYLCIKNIDFLSFALIMKNKEYPNQSELRDLFDYKDGVLYWKTLDKFGNRKEAAGHVHKHTGYVTISWIGSSWRAHRFIWIWHFGDIPEHLELDHINRVRADNRIENLRLVTRSDNQVNKDSDGIKGISFHKRDQRWQASIKVNNKRIHIGYFKSPEEVSKAFKEVELQIRGYNSD